jgi:hypothetical protein
MLIGNATENPAFADSAPQVPDFPGLFVDLDKR